MSTSAAAQQTNTMHFNLNAPSAIHIADGGNMGFKVEKNGNSSSRTPGEGSRNSPILVALFQYGQQGSKDEPIILEDEAEMTGDLDHPISVDDYEFGGGAEQELVAFAIRESLVELDCFEISLNDPKGKKPKIERERRSRRSIREVGESSNLLPLEPDAYCSICMEPKFKYECLTLKNCSHLYCSSCVSQYVEAKVEENVTSIGCPDPSCKDGYLEPVMCQSILKPEVFNRWGTALCEAMIGSMKFYCPFKDCSALLIDEGVTNGEEVIKESECPHCFRLFCAQCKVPWHMGLSCEDFAKLGADERGQEDIMLRNVAKKCNWQRCSKCKFYVEKIEGCMFIKCRCGHQFCYGCATPMTTDHYCQKCRR